MYDSIKKQQILQPTVAVARASTSSLTPSSPLSRARSHRNTPSSDRLNNLKRGSVRGLQSLLANQSAFNTSSPLDGRISPSPSYVTSIGEVSVMVFSLRLYITLNSLPVGCRLSRPRVPPFTPRRSALLQICPTRSLKKRLKTTLVVSEVSIQLPRP